MLPLAYPNGALADNTQYWLGEAYLITQEYDHAAAAVPAVWPELAGLRKAPDALLKVGYTQQEQGKSAYGKGHAAAGGGQVSGFGRCQDWPPRRLAKLPKQ